MKALVALLLLCGSVRADYVLAIHGPGCIPCMQMAPVEKQLRSLGYDIRTIELTGNADDPNAKLAAYYRVTRWPQYIYVRTTARGDFDSGAPHLVGTQTAGQLARYCVTPGVVGVVGAVRSAVRSLFSPIPTVSP